MKRLNAYLHFGGNCAAAMQFYKECLGGELRLMTVKESPMASQMPPAMMDMLCANGTSKVEIEGYFSKLSAGGKVNTALREEFFGTYGDFTDKFGIDWIFQADPPQR